MDNKQGGAFEKYIRADERLDVLERTAKQAENCARPSDLKGHIEEEMTHTKSARKAARDELSQALEARTNNPMFGR